MQSSHIPTATNKKRKRLVWLMLVLLLLAVCGYLLWTSPLLGRKLPQFTFEPLPTFTALPVTPTEDLSTQPDSEPTPIIEQEGTQDASTGIRPVCGQTEPMLILALGIDEAEQADMIRVVRVDFVKRQVMVLSIPRDFWVPIPGLEEHNITQFRINAAYGYGEYFNGPGQGVV